MAYISDFDKKVVISKGFMKEEEFLAEYDKLIADKVHERGPMLLHFRIATAGAVTRDNTHPFRVKNGAMVHNGCLWAGTLQDKHSDTRKLAAIMHNNLTYDAVTSHKKSIEENMGWNKFAFLYDGGKYAIVGEEDGYWDGGVWYSNAGYKSNYFRT